MASRKEGDVVAYGFGRIGKGRIAPIAKSYEARVSGSEDYEGGHSILHGVTNTVVRDKTIEAGFNWYQLDYGYHGKRGEWWRFTKNALTQPYIRDVPPDRWESFKPKVKPWQKRGDHILLTLQTGHALKFSGEENFERVMKARIREFTDRPIKVRQKGIGGIDKDLHNAWCVVTSSSSSALDALIHGIPAYSTCACTKPIEDDLSKIERPTYPEREPLFWSLAYSQFTVEELENGYARDRVESNNDVLGSWLSKVWQKVAGDVR